MRDAVSAFRIAYVGVRLTRSSAHTGRSNLETHACRQSPYRPRFQCNVRLSAPAVKIADFRPLSHYDLSDCRCDNPPMIYRCPESLLRASPKGGSRLTHFRQQIPATPPPLSLLPPGMTELRVGFSKRSAENPYRYYLFLLSSP